jgi:hypothetical protein
MNTNIKLFWLHSEVINEVKCFSIAEERDVVFSLSMK